MARGRTAPIKAFLLDQRHDRGRRQHLRRRGAVPRGRPSAAPGRAPDARAVRAAARRRSSRRCRRGSTRAGRRSTTSATSTACAAPSRTEFLVHLREGEPCVRCGTTIVKMVVGGRGTYVCEQLPAAAAARRRRRPSGSRRGVSGAGARSGGEQLVELAVLGGRLQLGEAAEQRDRRRAPGGSSSSRCARELDAPGGVLGRG